MDNAESTACRILEDLYPDRRDDWFGPMVIGGRPDIADRGAAAILTGIKTATSSLPSEFVGGREPFPGALSVVLDGSGRPRGVVETTRVERRPFGSVDAAFAAAYGEGELTLSWFRREIGGWYRARAAERGEPFDDDTLLILEWFHLVQTL